MFKTIRNHLAQCELEIEYAFHFASDATQTKYLSHNGKSLEFKSCLRMYISLGNVRSSCFFLCFIIKLCITILFTEKKIMKYFNTFNNERKAFTYFQNCYFH